MARSGMVVRIGQLSLSTSSEVVMTLESLDDVLEVGLRSGATSVSIELDSSGDLEVTFFSGDSGLGAVIAEPDVRRRIISELESRAGLEMKATGVIRVTSASRVRVIHVSTRDHFGESAYDLRFGA